MKKNDKKWRDDAPIYRQITDLIIERIISGEYAEETLLPSVRQLSDELDVSTLTTAKVFQELNGKDITIKRRGIGAEVRKGAQAKLLTKERKKFLDEEWPLVAKRIVLLGVNRNELP